MRYCKRAICDVPLVVSFSIGVKSLDLRLLWFPTLTWGCQTLLCDRVVIKVVLGHAVKYVVRYE